MYGSSECLVHLRFLILCLIGFAGFFRISELLEVKVKDLNFFDDRVEIFVTKSKTDQLREGNTVFICKTGTFCLSSILA